MDVVQIPLAQIKPARDVRGKVDVSDLVEAFQAQGQLHPVTVAPAEGGKYLLYAGHRRYRAAKQLRWKTLAAVVRAVPPEALEEAAIYENLARKSLSVKQTAREIARLKELHKALGLPASRVSTATGLAPRTVQRMAKLGSKGSEELLDAVDAGKVTKHAAEQIANLSDEEQAAAVAAAQRAESRAPTAGGRLTAHEWALLGMLVNDYIRTQSSTFTDDDTSAWGLIRTKVQTQGARAKQ